MKNNPQPTPVDSVLVAKASGCLNINNDLQMSDGKSIIQLIYEEEKTQKTTK